MSSCIKQKYSRVRESYIRPAGITRSGVSGVPSQALPHKFINICWRNNPRGLYRGSISWCREGNAGHVNRSGQGVTLIRSHSHPDKPAGTAHDRPALSQARPRPSDGFLPLQLFFSSYAPPSSKPRLCTANDRG